MRCVGLRRHSPGELINEAGKLTAHEPPQGHRPHARDPLDPKGPSESGEMDRGPCEPLASHSSGSIAFGSCASAWSPFVFPLGFEISIEFCPQAAREASPPVSPTVWNSHRASPALPSETTMEFVFVVPRIALFPEHAPHGLSLFGEGDGDWSRADFDACVTQEGFFV